MPRTLRRRPRGGQIERQCTSLRELQGWGIVRAVRVLGDRRFISSVSNVWGAVPDHRGPAETQEIDPTVDMLRRALMSSKDPSRGSLHARSGCRVLEFFETTTERRPTSFDIFQ